MFQTHEQMIKDIQNNWKNSWLKYFFAFTDLAVVLNAPNEPNKKDFIKAYLNAWNITRYFLNFLIDSKQQKQFQIYTSKFLIVKEIMIKNGLYNIERFESIWMIASSDLYEKFLDLDIAGRLSGYQLHLLSSDQAQEVADTPNEVVKTSDTSAQAKEDVAARNEEDNRDHSSPQPEEAENTTNEAANTVDTSAQAKEDVDAKNEEDNRDHSSPQPEDAADTTYDAANTVDTSAQAKEDVDAKNEEDNGNHSSPQPEEAANTINEDVNTDNSSAQAKVTLTSTSMFNASSKGDSSKSKKQKKKIKIGV